MNSDDESKKDAPKGYPNRPGGFNPGVRVIGLTKEQQLDLMALKIQTAAIDYIKKWGSLPVYRSLFQRFYTFYAPLAGYREARLWPLEKGFIRTINAKKSRSILAIPLNVTYTDQEIEIMLVKHDFLAEELKKAKRNALESNPLKMRW